MHVEVESRDGKRILIRRMRRSDVAAVTRLKQVAQWNQTHGDFRRFLAMEPGGSYVASWSGRVVGSVTTCSFRPVGWIGMMLVDPPLRRQGIATHLMETALGRLGQLGCTCVRLDATELGAPLYRRLGFRAEQEVVRYGGTARVDHQRNCAVRVRGFQWDDWPSVRDLDQQAVGADRTKLLKRLLCERSQTARVVSQNGRLQGYAVDRPGSYARLLGPIIALREQVGRVLLADTLRGTDRGPVVLDVLVRNCEARSAAEEAGLTAQRQFVRMTRGGSCGESPRVLWASSGPEKG